MRVRVKSNHTVKPGFSDHREQRPRASNDRFFMHGQFLTLPYSCDVRDFFFVAVTFSVVSVALHPCTKPVNRSTAHKDRFMHQRGGFFVQVYCTLIRIRHDTRNHQTCGLAKSCGYDFIALGMIEPAMLQATSSRSTLLPESI